MARNSLLKGVGCGSCPGVRWQIIRYMAKPVASIHVEKNIFSRTGPSRSARYLATDPPMIAAGAANINISHDTLSVINR